MRPSSISIENIFSLLTKTKNVRGFNKKNRGFAKFNENRILFEANI